MKLKLFIIFWLTVFNLNIYANEIVIVDIDYLIKNSNYGIKINDELKKKNDNLIKNFEKQEKNFKNLEQNLLSKKKIISDDEFTKEVQLLKDEILAYNKKKKDLIEKFNVEREKKFSELNKLINDIMINYSKDNQVKIILDKKYVLITRTDNEITNEIMSYLNK